MSVPQADCPCCKAQDLLFLGRLQDTHWFAGKYTVKPLSGGSLYRCNHCRLKFRYPILTPQDYLQMYDNMTASTWPADMDRPDWNLITQYVHEHLPHGGRVLDFGCYSGGLLKHLGPTYERHGIEVNRAAAAVAAENSQAHIWTSIEDIPGELHFDIIIAADVIEHISNTVELIDELFSALDENGVLIITTGDADNTLWNRFGANWWYCFYPEHIVFISKPWLDYLSTIRNITIRCCETFHYCKLSSFRRFVDTLFTYGYGLFPYTYLRLGSLLKNVFWHTGMVSVPGNGVSADHLFIILTRGKERI